MKKLILFLCLICTFSVFSQNNEEKDKEAIQAVLKEQRLAWSKNNIEKYMEGYWKSDSLKFYGSNGVTYGWENTLQRYKKAYPSKEHTGKLSFKINDISKITDGAYFVLGEFHLKRDVGNATGIFMLVFKKINGEWKIIADTSA
ncbi:YybH family protein [Aestuariibaculum suncheonense]|uniref:Nuclear transport factor 2 family protein n=1 Tax=Aestuariibaculum suncheonense TaxID=1028745 RepID=A0A8J6UIG5_9FLAO|nr:nuclear transport factor 2 family protein [Aestuariibaculum suncheonense]MBD0834151.1 nuclear transport factor 2 family protein [Aestuariibaculum suncheonense]